MAAVGVQYGPKNKEAVYTGVPALDTWLDYRQPNYCLLISNVFYIAAAIAVLVIGVGVLQEHADDVENNPFSAQNGSSETNPCGFATPDALHLLQAIGEVPASGAPAALLNPDYGTWIDDIEKTMCNIRVVPNPDSWSFSTGYATLYTEELLFFSSLLSDSSFRPSNADLTATAPDLTAKLNLFEDRMCLQADTDDGVKQVYPGQQHDVYGDIKVRVARAYLAAMPAFYKLGDGTCLGDSSPFNSDCPHTNHIGTELKSAATDGDATLLVTGDVSALPEFTTMLYRLFALSVFGYYDRKDNDGACFKNGVYDSNYKPTVTALEFCQAAFASVTDTTSVGTTALTAYGAQQQKIHDALGCTATSTRSPPPPAPPIIREEGETASVTVDVGVEEMCAHMLQYGLFEQGMFFGMPDPVGPFIIDKRGGDFFPHFFAPLIYNALYVNPMKDGNDIFNYPNARLEAYMAYRLAGTTIWGQITGSVTGYFAFRAIVPMLIFSLRLLKIKDFSGKTIKLFRPPPELPIFAAVGVAIIAGYWLLYIDPAVQSWYPVTSSCEDWDGQGSQVPSGVYVTSWGKRRFDRQGESALGILLFSYVFVFGFHFFVGRKCIPADEEERLGESKFVKRTTGAFWFVFLFAFGNVLVFAGMATNTGLRWYKAANRQDDTTALTNDYSKDCVMAVFASFWATGAVASTRGKWTVQSLTVPWKILWAAGTILLVWMPLIQAGGLLAEELQVAFSETYEDEHKRQVLYSLIIAFSAIQTGLVIFLFYDLYVSTPDNSRGIWPGGAKYIAEVKKSLRERREAAKGTSPGAAAARLLNRYGQRAYRGLDGAGAFNKIGAQADGDGERFRFDFSDAQFNPTQAPIEETGQTGGASYAVPRGRRGKDTVQYMPMLRFQS